MRATERSGRAATGPWKTAIVFWGVGSEAPGWLVACLSEFAARDVNLTRIESRPRKQGLGRYMFFADLEGEVTPNRTWRRRLAGRARARRGAAGARLVSGRLTGAGGGNRHSSPLHLPRAMATSVLPAPAGSAPPPEHQRRGREVGRVLVLNATYEPINVCTVRRAVVLLLKEKAEVIEHAEWELHSATSTIDPARS